MPARHLGSQEPTRRPAGARAALFAGAAAVAFCAAIGAAQSPNAFGIPSADKPQPGASINAVPGSRAQGWPGQGRSEVLARHGMVATSDPLAAQAGLEILRQGGNAIDAAVATGAVLDVTSQNDTGIGGDLFAIVWSARDKKLYALNSGGWAPAGWTPQFFTEKLGVKSVPGSGVERGDGSRRDLRLRRAVETLRHDDLQGNLRARRPDRRGRLGPGGAPPLGSRAAPSRPSCRPGLQADVSRRRSGAGSVQHHPQSGPGEGAAAPPAAGPRRLLQGRHRGRDRREGAGERRRDEPERSRRSSSRNGSSRSRPTITATTCSSCRRPDRASRRWRC